MKHESSNMKKLLLTSTTFALIAGNAAAADLPSIKSAPVVTQTPMWTGFYAGLNSGGMWSNSNTYLSSYPLYSNPVINRFSAPTAGIVATGNVSTQNSGFIGGGQIGYNWQAYDRFVLGLEADIQGIAGTSGQGSGTSAGYIPSTSSDTWTAVKDTSNNLSYLGTVRGRIGFLVTPSLLIFGSGGLAYGGINSNTSSTWIGIPTPSFSSGGNVFYGSGNVSNSQVGWAAGGGADWMFMSNWSAKIEYLYYDLGNANYTFSSVRPRINGGPNFVMMTNSSTRFNGNIIRAGVNYHFNFANTLPVVAKY